MPPEVTVDLQDGRRVTFERVVLLEWENETWLRCVSDEISSREKLPETTRYYHLADDVDRIIIKSSEVTKSDVLSYDCVERQTLE